MAAAAGGKCLTECLCVQEKLTLYVVIDETLIVTEEFLESELMTDTKTAKDILLHGDSLEVKPGADCKMLLWRILHRDQNKKNNECAMYFFIPMTMETVWSCCYL